MVANTIPTTSSVPPPAEVTPTTQVPEQSEQPAPTTTSYPTYTAPVTTQAPSGGSVFFRNSSKRELDNGDQVSVSSDNCCLIWDQSIDKPLRVRVVWSVVFDMTYHNGKSSVEYDERTSKMSSPGSRWCQAIVDILPAKGPERPTMVFFHFFTDGTVHAQLGTFKTDAPLPAAQVKLHSARLPQGQFCKQEIENPFYGIPRTPHME